MAKKTIEARVKQKTGTLSEWNANPLVLLDGEPAFVRNDTGAPMNFKIGDGTKTFAELPFWIAYDQAAFVAVSGNTLPASDGNVHYSIVPAGTYTQSGGADVVVTEGSLGIISDDGTSWSLVDTVELPDSSAKAKDWVAGTYTSEQTAVKNGILYRVKADVSSTTGEPGVSEDWEVLGNDVEVADETGDSTTVAASQRIVTSIAIREEVNLESEAGLGIYIAREKGFYENFNVNVEESPSLIKYNGKKSEISAFDGSISGSINASRNQEAYGAHTTYYKKLKYGDVIFLDQTSTSTAPRTAYCFYRLPKGVIPIRANIIQENSLPPYEVFTTTYVFSNKQIIPPDVDLEIYDLYFCLVVRDADTYAISVQSYEYIVLPISTDLTGINDELENIDREIFGTESEISAITNDGFFGSYYINDSGNVQVFGNRNILYWKLTDEYRLYLTQNSTDTLSRCKFGFYQVDKGTTVTSANLVLSANRIGDYETANSPYDLEAYEIPIPEFSDDKDLYFCLSTRSTDTPPAVLEATYKEGGIENRLEKIEQEFKKPFENKSVFFAGDSNTMYFRYFESLQKQTGIVLSGTTGALGNGATSVSLVNTVKEMDLSGDIDWGNIDVFSIFVGGNDWERSTPAGDFESSLPNTIYGAIKELITYVYQRALEEGNQDIFVILFSRPERDNFQQTQVTNHDTTIIIDDVKEVVYTGRARGLPIAVYDSGGNFIESYLNRATTYNSEEIIFDSAKRIRLSAYKSSPNYSFNIKLNNGTDILINQSSVGYLETENCWITDPSNPYTSTWMGGNEGGILVYTDYYWNFGKNQSQLTMFDVGDIMRDCAKRMGCPTLDLYSLSGVTKFNLRYWIPDGTHYNQLLGDKLGSIMGKWLNTLS